jgi:hypothetical protein
MFKSLFDKMNSRFIIGGDFNAKHANWGSRLVTTKGRDSYKAVTDTGYEIVSTGKPMYWPTDPKDSKISLIFCGQKYFKYILKGSDDGV